MNYFFLGLILSTMLHAQDHTEKPKCPKKKHYFNGQCIRVPKHAEGIDQAPGWKCKPGYTIGHYGCKKVSVPKHATLTSDGISWTCNEGYEPYRGTCKKK